MASAPPSPASSSLDLWAAYAIIVGRAGNTEGQRRFGRPGVTFATGVVVVAWVAILALLWPVLDTNFLGLPPGTARFVTSLGLLFSFAVYGAALVLVYRYVTGREPTGRVVESGTPQVGRRAFLAGAAGAIFVWGYDWTPEEPGEYALIVRATDGTGELQTSEFRRASTGKGATGLHRVTARVEA